jgi:hypothetical protein
MNRGNARLNTDALDQLELMPDDRVLEIGFGGGPVLTRLLGGASFVCGVDRSDDVVSAASRKYADAVRAGGRGVGPGHRAHRGASVDCDVVKPPAPSIKT